MSFYLVLRVWLLGFSLFGFSPTLGAVEHPEDKAKMVIFNQNHNLYPSICNCCSSDSDSAALSAFDLCLILLLLLWLFAAVAQDLQNQEEVGEEDEAEQAHPLLDPHENRQHHQVRIPYLSYNNGSVRFTLFKLKVLFSLSGTMLSAATGVVPSLDSEVFALPRFGLSN